MSKGRNTAVVGVRLPDEVISRLKSLARQNRQTMTELLKPVISDFAVNGRVGGVIQDSPEVAPKQPRKVPSPQQDVFPKVGRNDPRSSVSRGSPTPVTSFHKVGRNDPCPCGSGKKYKKCHGA